MLSAKFGLIGALTEIEDYDPCMTPHRVSPLLDQNAATASASSQGYANENDRERMVAPIAHVLIIDSIDDV